jgi:hypothetical protein
MGMQSHRSNSQWIEHMHLFKKKNIPSIFIPYRTAATANSMETLSRAGQQPAGFGDPLLAWYLS